MNIDNEILERIESYVRGDMSEVEKTAFEKEINTDPALNELVQLSIISEEIVVGYEVLKLKEQMQKDLNKPKSFSWKLYTGLLFLISVPTALYFTNKTTEPGKELKIRNSTTGNNKDFPVLTNSIEDLPKEVKTKSQKERNVKKEIKKPTQEVIADLKNTQLVTETIKADERESLHNE